jgi:transposase
METGTRTCLPTGKIDYKQLRAINPEAARKAVLEYLKTNNHNIANAARVFGINRPVVYDILKKEKEGDLKDRSRRPKNSPHRTPDGSKTKLLRLKTKQD